MKLKPKFIPFLALGSGAVLFLLRLWLFTTGLDARNLLRPEHPANALVFLVLALSLVLFYLCLRPLTGKPEYQKLFPKNLISTAGSFLGAVGILITVFSDMAAVRDSISILCFVLGVLAAVGLLLAGLLRYTTQRLPVFLHGFVAVFLMVYLVFRYRVWSAEPELQEYFFQLLAAVFVMITAYHRACLDGLVGSRRDFVFFNYSSVMLCFAASLYSDAWMLYAGLGIWCATSACNLEPQREMALPQAVRQCLSKLEASGFEAYVVGGCVRDSLLGLTPQDFDLCTNATPKEVAHIFRKYDLVRNGEKHGTIGVIIDKTVYEITTFRTEGAYSDNRHPDRVNFVRNLHEDLSRRDFTINAMAYSPRTGYIDLFEGRKDLQNRVLRTVGAPKKRFSEDALRILRGVRFAVRFDLMPETKTFQAMTALAPTLDSLAKERVFSELCKLLVEINAQQLIEFAPVLTAAIPEIKACVNFNQHSPHHAYDVYTHTAHVVAALPADSTLRWAGLLHDISKPQVFTTDADGRGHFHNHAQAGAEVADAVLCQLRAPKSLRERVVFLVENHMTPLTPDKKLLRRYLSKWGEEALRQLLQLQKADFQSKGVAEETNVDFAEIEACINQLVEEENCLCTQDLAVSGNDIMALGVQPGPQIGACLQQLLTLVLEQTIPNEKGALLQAAQNYLQDNREAE